ASSPNLSVIRVRTRQTLCRPDISQLILSGARACGYPVPAAIIAELSINPGADGSGVFCGTVDGAARVVAIGFLPANAFWLAATVSLAYSDNAPHRLVSLVAQKMREWFKSEGHEHVIVANLLHTDRSYLRGLRYFGKPSRIGGVIRFDF